MGCIPKKKGLSFGGKGISPGVKDLGCGFTVSQLCRAQGVSRLEVSSPPLSLKAQGAGGLSGLQGTLHGLPAVTFKAPSNVFGASVGICSTSTVN